MRLHDLRHTFGTLAVQAFPLSDVNAYMGHAQIETTMSYVHHVPHHDAADKLTALVADARRPVSVHLRAPGRSRCDRASPPPSSRVDVTNSLASGPRISSITNIRPLRSGLTPGPSRKPRNSAAPGFRKVCRSARRCFQLRRRPGVERMATHGGEGPGSQRIRPPASGAPGGHGRPPFCRSAARCLPLVPASLGAATRQAGLWPGIPPNLMRRPALTLRGPGDGKERASQGYIPSPWRTRATDGRFLWRPRPRAGGRGDHPSWVRLAGPRVSAPRPWTLIALSGQAPHARASRRHGGCRTILGRCRKLQ